LCDGVRSLTGCLVVLFCASSQRFCSDRHLSHPGTGRVVRSQSFLKGSAVDTRRNTRQVSPTAQVCPSSLLAIFPPRAEIATELPLRSTPHFGTVGYALDPDSLRENRNGLTAQLNLAGPPCNAFGKDILNLTIQITYGTASR
jgi:hypothetical protein